MKKLLLSGAFVLFSHFPAFAADECGIENHCIQEQDFQVQVAKAKMRGKIATVSLRMKNLSKKPVNVRLFGTYLEAVSESGEYRRLHTNLADRFELRAGQLRSLGYTIEFEEDAGESIDLTLTLTKPSASFSFFDIK